MSKIKQQMCSKVLQILYRCNGNLSCLHITYGNASLNSLLIASMLVYDTSTIDGGFANTNIETSRKEFKDASSYVHMSIDGVGLI